ncbi:NAD(P)-dependent alcohol dehydrogenase [Mycobacterium intracellulare]|uniref:zinc-dependent alcohol dehydrogenase family protein n=1 Tax=Mycobacterium intracellulare TaxID=1767 RepID=UPI003351647F
MSIPTTQQAFVITGPGEQLRRVERPVEEPGPGQALVRVHALSLNFHDTVNLLGLIPGPWPRVPMTDGAGQVVALGLGVRGIDIGQRVTGAFHPGWRHGPPTPQAKHELPGDTCDGWLQQYKLFDASALVSTPPHLSDVQAATLPCAGVTAWSALAEADIGKGDVVVTLGTGGVSVFAVQLATALGATVILTSSADEKLEHGSRLGAAHLINYHSTPDWHTQVQRLTDGRGADMVIDLGGPATLAQSVRAARMGGTVAVVGVLGGFDMAQVPVAEVMLNNIRLVGITVGSVKSHTELCELVAQANIVPHISHVFDWEHLPEAVRVMQAGEHIGKIGITIP